MDDSKILIIGANGQLGKALKAKYPSATAIDREELDISNAGAVAAYDWAKFNTVINAAAYTNVDGAETSEGRLLAQQINAVGPANLACVATQNDFVLVHISTDYVFDGVHQNHSEDEALSPLSFYGKSKADGDTAVSATPKHYILRTSWLIGDGPNFVRTMIGLAQKGVSPTVVSDQIGRLTFTPTLVAGIDHLLKTQAPYGTYNLTNDGEPASWADITRLIFKAMDQNDLTVTNTTTSKYFASRPNVAPRPLNSALDLHKIKASGFTPTDWIKELNNYVKKELS